MAKKEKQPKKGKAPKKAKAKGRKQREPDIPYAGSDGVKTFLARTLCVLCAICLGMMVYSIHYFRFNEKKLQKEAAEARAAADAAAAAAKVGPSWFSRPDGTVVSIDNIRLAAAPADDAPTADAPQPAAVMVWRSDSGILYHSRSDCDDMEDGSVVQIPMQDALSQGLERCEKCW